VLNVKFDTFLAGDALGFEPVFEHKHHVTTHIDVHEARRNVASRRHSTRDLI